MGICILLIYIKKHTQKKGIFEVFIGKKTNKRKDKKISNSQQLKEGNL